MASIIDLAAKDAASDEINQTINKHISTHKNINGADCSVFQAA